MQSLKLMASSLRDAVIARLNSICPASCFFADWVHPIAVLGKKNQSRLSQLRYLMTYRVESNKFVFLLAKRLILINEDL